MEVDELLLQTGADIPFAQARLTIHQPLLKEIAFMGESNFHIGSQFLLFDKNNLSDKDKVGLENQSNFNIFMSVMHSHEKAIHKTCALMILALLFPEAKMKVEADKILLQLEQFSSSINEQNFVDFQSIIKQIFCLGDKGDSSNYDPADALAARIANKIKKGKEKLAEKKGIDITKISIYSKYISILAVGLNKDKNELSNYTVYQLMDEFERFQRYQSFDIYIKAKMAGAQDLEEVDNWMGDLHS
jgi:hypothetical protein